MKKILLSALVLGLVIVPTVAFAKPTPPIKVWVCKYVGTPGVNETLKDGKNPISVDENSIKDFQGVGSFFNDAQGRSFVVALVTEENKDNPPTCPAPEKDVCPNIDGIQTSVPDNDVLVDGNCVPKPVNNPSGNNPSTTQITPPTVQNFTGK